MKSTVIALMSVFVVVMNAAAQIEFADGTSLNTGTLSNVTVVQAGGTPTANGTALKAAMNAISMSNTTPLVIQLAAGNYNLGADPLTMRPSVLLRGLGRQSSIITGTGSVLVEGADATIIRDLQLKATTSNSILLRVQNGAFVDTFRVAFVLESTGGATATGIQVLSGGELDVVSGIIAGDTDNAGGSVTGLSVSGTNSSAFLYNSVLDIVELSSGTLTGISTGSGATVEIITGEYVIERENAGSDVTLLTIGSGSRAIIKNSSVLARVNGNSIGIDTVVIPTTGGLLVFGTILEGDIPATSTYVNEFNHVIYSNSSQNFTTTP